MSYLEQLIRSGAAEGLQINLWPCDAGYQGNVKERGGSGWTVEIRADPVDAIAAALSTRLTKLPSRHVVSDEEQLDIEAAIAAASVPSAATDDSDDFEELL